jgi:hypothetical protein
VLADNNSINLAAQQRRRAVEAHFTDNSVPIIKRLAYLKEAEWGAAACKWASARLLGFEPPPRVARPSAEVRAAVGVWVQEVRGDILGLQVPEEGSAAEEGEQLTNDWAKRWVEQGQERELRLWALVQLFVYISRQLEGHKGREQPKLFNLLPMGKLARTSFITLGSTALYGLLRRAKVRG